MKMEHRKSIYPSPRQLCRAFCAVLAFCLAPTGYATDPMSSPQSMEIREAFAACREKPTEMSRFLCHCSVVDRQCETALKPQHGQWRTIEVWHGENEADREVFFHLAPRPEDLFALEQFDQGIIVSCLVNTSAVTIHLGETIDILRPVQVKLDGTPLAVELVEEGINVLAVARDTEDATLALSSANEMIVLYADEGGDDVEVTYQTAGFAAAMSGWEPLCKAAIS